MGKDSIVTISDAFTGVKVFNGGDMVPPRTIIISKDLFEAFKIMTSKQIVDEAILDEVRNTLASMLEHP